MTIVIKYQGDALQVRIIGGSGGVTDSTSATSYLIDDSLLIDAGSAATGLSISEQVKIDHILISHAHLDHTKDLAFICDNCFGMRSDPFQVHTHKSTKDAIKKHLFNEVIWPDFSELPNKENPTIVFNEIVAEKELTLGKYKVMPVHVEHPGDAMGFIVTKDDTSVLFTQDTRATDKIWELAKNYKNLKAIFTEVSFPNKLQGIADASDHHTPSTMKEELKKMPKDIPVYLGHLKPNYHAELISEIHHLREPRIQIMDKDQLKFKFD